MREEISSLLETSLVLPPPDNKRATITSLEQYHALVRKFREDQDETWRELAMEHLSWARPFARVLNAQDAPFYRWFEDGELNVAVNCLDRHVQAGLGARTAIVWEGEPGEVVRINYTDLLEEVCRAANAFRAMGIAKGDRVVFYMPMIPEAVVAMLACARIGAIHSVVFGAFSAKALQERIEDAQAKLVVTADGGFRKGEVHPLKPNVDEALQAGCKSVRHVVVVRRCGNKVDWHHGRDLEWRDILDVQPRHCDPVALGAEHPLFILYTSGSTGKPKGVVHASAGYLLWARLTMFWSFDFRPDEDVHWCTADIGWITGHTYTVYGPLACGGTSLIYEGLPVHPDPGRIWKICSHHRVSILYTAPTLIRTLRKAGDEWPAKHDLSSLRVLGTVGEPIDPDAWLWFHEKVGASRCPVVDTWWQTETGGHMIAPLPFATPTKPGSATLPLPGVFAEVVNDDGKPMPPNQGGYLVLCEPWPSMLRGLWGDPERYRQTYWQKFGGKFYFTGDGARKDEDGYFWIMGRVDDVINVSGHRLGTMEIESALASHPQVAEAAVVGKPHEVKGEAICAFVVTKQPVEDQGSLVQDLRRQVAEVLGPIAKPDEIRFCPALPKTRSGKIMRRLLRDIATGREIHQDISTLEDQRVIAWLQAGKEEGKENAT